MNTHKSFPSLHAFVGETFWGVITRRDFWAIAAAALLARPRRAYPLQAIAAERMPHTLVIHMSDRRLADRERIFELREYQSHAPDIAVLRRCGIEPINSTGATLLIPFDSLEARDRAWTRFNVENSIERNASCTVPRSISLYRAA
jgi:hypothetical protein